jgi:hypothetical protein
MTTDPIAGAYAYIRELEAKLEKERIRRKTVTRLGDLEALADGSIVLPDGERTPYFYDWTSGWLKLGHDSNSFVQPDEMKLPATVLWEGQ